MEFLTKNQITITSILWCANQCLSYIICCLLFSSCASYDYGDLYEIKLEEATKKHLSGDYMGARLIYEELLKSNKNPQFRETVLLHLANLYFTLKDSQHALSILNRLVNTSEDIYILGGANFALANYYYEEKQFDMAKRYIVNTLKYPDKFYSLYLALQLAAKIFYYLKDIENAKHYFLKLATIFPNDPYSQKIFSILDVLSNGDLYLQVGKFSSLENAKNLMIKLSVLGYNSIVKEVIISNSKFSLVLVTCKTHELCKKFREDLTKIEVDALEIP